VEELTRSYEEAGKFLDKGKQSDDEEAPSCGRGGERRQRRGARGLTGWTTPAQGRWDCHAPWRLRQGKKTGARERRADQRVLPRRQERLGPPDHVGFVLGQAPHVGGPRLQLGAVKGDGAEAQRQLQAGHEVGKIHGGPIAASRAAGWLAARGSQV